MIFISHNHKDKEIVEPFANRLADVFDRENIFYDSWSIQPGEGIIEKINESLSSLNHFFFFVSSNSLQSNMVKLEWQNALMKAINGEIKFIPIRLDRSEMPAVLQQVLYLDVYTNGFDIVLRQMIDVINGNNIYHGEARHYENIRAHVKMLSEAVMEIDIFAVTYMEPISRYLVLVTNSETDVTWNSPTDPLILTGYNKDVKVNTIFGDKTVNALAVTLQRPTTPEFPVKIKVQSETKIDFKGIMRAKNDKIYVTVPFNFV